MENHERSLAASALFISHGGGPLPLLGDPSHKEMVAGLQHIATLFVQPSALLVISAHWEAEHVTVTSGANPSLLYDYSGFPRRAYTIQYPAPGNPELAGNIQTVFEDNGIQADLDRERGFDHGVFVPLKIMYPEADIPCVQISLVKGLSPAEHIKIGKALAQVQEDNLLIVGSGFSFHNMKAFFTPPTEAVRSMNTSFEEWLVETCSNHGLSDKTRERRLIEWERVPAARFCHPREEHLLPLHVCYGAAQAPAKKVFSWQVMGKQVSAYLW